ncbi:MAG: hypothetical protein K0R28_5337 [Paenibacillus sp.]|nr:hypothetical protein [Paenibacillus sp.]
MEAAVVIGIVLLITLLLIGNASGKKKRPGRTGNRGTRSVGSRPSPQLPPYETGVLPDRLGLLPDVPLHGTARRLEQAFDAGFGSQLKRRVLDKYPRMTEAEYDYKLLELKRYLLMNAVLKGVPMFSPEVDDIWHEMLMFTREYERFCEEWNGRTVHHAPHGEAAPMPGERAWFDWVYSQLFVATPYSGRIWRGFFRYPLDAGLLQSLEREAPETIAGKRFSGVSAQTNPETEQTIALLIRKAKEQISQSKTAPAASGAIPGTANPNARERWQERPDSSSAYSGTANFAMLGSAMLLFSITDPTGYEQQMEAVMPEEEKRNQSSCGGSSCSGASGDGRDSDTGDGGDTGGSSDGGSSSGNSSSCSSSSCSSGCGGGGD